MKQFKFLLFVTLFTATLTDGHKNVRMGRNSETEIAESQATTTVITEDEDTTENVNEMLHDQDDMEHEENDEDEGLDNTDINCHKCLKASFNFRKVKY